MPTWILWLSPVIVAPLLAVVWTSWSTRPRGPEQALETVQEYDRFRAALTSPVPTSRHAGRSKAKAR
jgi:cytochrome c-type biogenesis protein CcmH/NrfF